MEMDGRIAKELYSGILQSSNVELDMGQIAAQTHDTFQDTDPSDSWYDDGSSCEGSGEKSNNTSDIDREWQKRRNEFNTIGYRDGIIAGKEDAAQEGFNIGFKESVFIGYKWGSVRGITSAMACLPSGLKEKLVETEETRNKFQCLHESVESLSRSDALKLFHEDHKKKSGNQNESAADPNSTTTDSNHQSPDFENYYGQLNSIIDESPLVDVHFKIKHLNTKCRTNIHLKSLSSTTPIAFKLQTTSPSKFLVNPSSGLLPPLSTATFQIILKPQPRPPPTFPRYPSDRFLLRTAAAPDLDPSVTDVSRWFNSSPDLPTYDVKLKVYYIGPYLLTHAVGTGNLEAVKGIIKRQRFIVSEIGGEEAECLYRAAAAQSADILNVLLEAGLRNAKVLVGAGVNVDARSKDGRTALCRAAANGDRRMVEMLLEAGADPTIGDVDSCRSAIDVARDKGHMEIVKVLERGESVLHAARRGELDILESLLEKGATSNFSDQYGLTPLHVAAIKGNKDVVMMLVEFGANIDSQDTEGHTPLHLAVEGGSIETVEILINRGANINAKNKKGATPLCISKLMEYEDITQLLLDKVVAV
ncbi:hypothetical protein ACJIZ3_022362 [Penstemon smallii]|uniref:MSP domain-containing protein n=1 Tax=Penstemon smallii TaxID=265156 RepID=A0ABD3TL08_9LAMI